MHYASLRQLPMEELPREIIPLEICTLHNNKAVKNDHKPRFGLINFFLLEAAIAEIYNF